MTVSSTSVPAPAHKKTWTPKNILRFALSLAVSAGCLWLVFHNVDWASMKAQIKAADHRYTVLFAVATAVIQICRIYRWDVLIRPFAKISTSALFRISSVGLMAIVVLPLRLGEFVRPFLLKKESGASMSSGIGSIVVERVVDGLLVTAVVLCDDVLSRQQVPDPGGREDQRLCLLRHLRRRDCGHRHSASDPRLGAAHRAQDWHADLAKDHRAAARDVVGFYRRLALAAERARL